MKTMRSYKGFIFALVLLLVSAGRAFAADTFAVDSVHSSAMFKASHFGIGVVRGVFSDISGTILVDKKNPAASSVDITIATKSLDTNSEKRDADLRSPNFFDVDKYPTMHFKSRKVVKAGKDKFRVTGDFTLLGVTKTITVNVAQLGEGKDPWGGYRIGFEAEFTVRRGDYGMKYMIPAIGDAVRITIAVEAIRK